MSALPDPRPGVPSGVIRTRALRYLDTCGAAGADAGEIRYCGGLHRAPAAELWVELRGLVDEGRILVSQRTSRLVWSGFVETRTYPVFSMLGKPGKGGEPCSV